MNRIPSARLVSLLGAAVLLASTGGAGAQQAPVYVYPPAVPVKEFPGYPKDSGYEVKPDAEPQTNKRQPYDGGLTVHAGTMQNSSLHWGELIKITYEFRHPESVTVDLSAIQRGIIGLENSDVKLRFPDQPQNCMRLSKRNDGDEVVERLEIELQHFIFFALHEEIEFHFDFRYMYLKPDGTPESVSASVPSMEFTVVRSGNRTLDWRYGSFPKAPVRSSPAGPIVLAMGVAFVLFELFYHGALLKQRFFPARPRTARQAALAALRTIKRDSKQRGSLTRAEVTELALTLRAAFDAQSVTGDEIAKYFAGKPHEQAIVSALTELDAASVDSTHVIADTERTVLLDNIASALGDR